MREPDYSQNSRSKILDLEDQNISDITQIGGLEKMVQLEELNLSCGDITEIKELSKALTTNEVRVLVGVKDDKYQQVYTKYFGRVKPQRDDLFIKALNDDYGSFNADFNADLKWGTHVATTTLVSPDTVAEEEDWTTPTTNGKSDDLPF